MSNTDRERLDGRRALVTGGTKGTGAAVAARLRELGADVYVTARSMPEEYAHPDRFVAADTTTADGTDRVAAALTEAGGAEIIVHVVGGSSTPPGGFAAADDAQWIAELQLNLLGAVRIDRALIPAMLEKGSGVVVHVTSIQREQPLHEATLPYAAAKAALRTYSKGLANEVGPRGVRVNAVSPGLIDTELHAAAGFPDRVAKFASAVPLARGGTAEEVAEAVLWLLSDAARYVTGANLPVSGGR